MTNKEHIIQLAKDIGFKSKFFHEEPLKHSGNEDLRWYLYLCEIQKWLRDVGAIYIEIEHKSDGYVFVGYNYYCYVGVTFEETIEVAILHILNPIKK